MKAIPAFREPAARLEVMDELGLDYSLMFPTLASLVEERMKDDPDLTIDVIHALNEWMYEQWKFDYEGRIFSTPVITLPTSTRRSRSCIGASSAARRPCSSVRLRSRLPGQPLVRASGVRPVLAGVRRRPASRSRCTPRTPGTPSSSTQWEPAKEFLPFQPTAFRMAAMGHRPIEDAMMALVCHGALTRNPDLRILSIENGAGWVPHLFDNLSSVYKKMPHEFLEDPIEAFKRCVYISPFWEDNFLDIVADGRSPTAWSSARTGRTRRACRTRSPTSTTSKGLAEDDIEQIMGGNMCELFKHQGARQRLRRARHVNTHLGEQQVLNDVLAGVKVVEVAAWTFVPAAGAVLAEWGADVIKVEPQRGR